MITFWYLIQFLAIFQSLRLNHLIDILNLVTWQKPYILIEHSTYISLLLVANSCSWNRDTQSNINLYQQRKNVVLTRARRIKIMQREFYCVNIYICSTINKSRWWIASERKSFDKQRTGNISTKWKRKKLDKFIKL